MKKSILCYLDIHKMGKWHREQVLVMGFPVEANIQRCERDGCKFAQIDGEFLPYVRPERSSDGSFNEFDADYMGIEEIHAIFINGKNTKI